MKFLESEDWRKQFAILLGGSTLFFLIYCVFGVFHQYLITLPYKNFQTGEMIPIPDKAIIVLAPTLVTWLLGNLYNRTLPERKNIPEKNSLICAVIIFISTMTYTWATAMTSFPVVMAFKSCNIISILLVAICCTRVRDKKLNLGPKKIIVGIIISLGVFLFSYFDPQQKDRTQTSQIQGIILLVISLLADGFLPDFQAEIKSLYKPQPTEMMEHINKWVAIISLGSMVLSMTFVSAFTYLFYHPLFAFHLICLSFLSAFGQFIVYTMIKLFKQHIVPFIITIRKILTVLISIIIYHHRTSWIQLVGMGIVILSVIYEFIDEAKSKKEAAKEEQKKNQNIQLNEEQFESQAVQSSDIGLEQGKKIQKQEIEQQQQQQKQQYQQQQQQNKSKQQEDSA